MKKFAFPIIFLCFLLAAGLAAFLDRSGILKPPAPAVSDPSVPDSAPHDSVPSENNGDEEVGRAVEKTKKTTATFAAVGDVLIHSSVYADARTADGFDFRPMFAPVKPLLRAADIATANQESMIGGAELGLSDYPRFNSPFAVGDALKDAGIDVVTMANNHTLDKGERGIRNAIRHWNRIGMVYTGAFASEADRAHIRTLTKNEITFSFLAYTYGTNGLPVPEGKDYLVNLIDKDIMTQDIRRARSLSDVVVVNLHFGQEYQRMPDTYQKDTARAAAAAGADIIIGHHPHVLQPPEWIVREDGRRSFVIYSLGNFIAAQQGIHKEIGGIINLTVEKLQSGKESRIILKDPVFVPTWAYKKNWRNYRVLPLSEVEKERMPHIQRVRIDVTRHMQQWMPELLVTAGQTERSGVGEAVYGE